jgi:hypothetical protein
MRRAPLIALAIGVMALALGVVLALSGVRVMPSYLAAWLFWLAIPAGALPLLMAFELAGAAASPILPPLRRLLALLPVAALFAIPVLFRLSALYPWRHTPQHGLAAAWFSPGFFVARMVLFLVVWAGLALIFLRPPPASGRRLRAGLGLALHLVIGTLAAIDWILSLEPGLASSSFGLLLIASECGIALSAAVLLGAGWVAPRCFVAPMLTLFGAWIFLHFTQFLVIWQADKPQEILWYLQRSSGLGAAAEGLGLVALLLLLALLWRGPARRPGVVMALAALVLALHAVEMLWLVTPAFRGHFSITLPDALAMAGIGGIALAVLLRPVRGAPLGRA